MNKFITADESRKISASNFLQVSNLDTEKLNSIIQEIEIKIKEATKKGEYDILYKNNSMSRCMVDFICMYLNKSGYQTTGFIYSSNKSIGIKWLYKIK